ncbi:MAG: S9 family peptidase [Bacteroidales bacterium]|nr:S9 family peptidase [Bacteroidales bacterium]MDD4671489.1 S9 family peptidase [Bacteroidales bacterium]MDY0348517.1 S9 family peptidase [Tenuifilaceae bacterium]
MLKQKLKLLLVMALAAGLWSCQDADTAKQTELITPDVELTAQEISNARLTPEVLWKFGRLGAAQVSPHGQTVLFTITRYSMEANKGVTNIYSIPVEGGEPTELTTNETNDFSPRWRPDGKRIGFLSSRSGDVQLWEMDANGANVAQTTAIEGGINSFAYAPTGDRILYTKNVQIEKTTKDLHPDMPKANVRITDNMMYRHWNYWRDGSFSHIFVAPYTNGAIGEAKDIMEGEPWDAPMSAYFDDSEIAWSPCGKIIAYTCKKLHGKDYAVSTNSDIYLYNVEDETVENITEGMMGYDKYPVFSPDGSKIAWQSMKTPGYESDKSRLFVLNLKTGERSYLTKGFDQDAESVSWSEDGKSLNFISGINATAQIYSLNLETKEIAQITNGWHNYTWYAPAKGMLVGSKMSMSMASELFTINPETGEEKQLTFINKHIYDNIKMGEVTQRWIKTTDGKQMLVWVILPPNFDKNKEYPALLYCQGGPQSAVSQFFSYRWNFQIMAAHDYVIVAPNRRGVPSFGKDWNAQISGDYSGQNIQDYLSAIDNAKQEPWIDENRLGAIGASYGGYSVFYLAGMHQNRFKTFIAHNGMFNFESFYASTEETFFPNHDFGGPFWDKKNKVAQRTYANSPHKFVQNWNTPIMVIVGENDFRIAYSEGLQAFNAAQLQGIPSRLAVYPDETHFVTKPQNAVVWQREFFGWLDKWLK